MKSAYVEHHIFFSFFGLYRHFILEWMEAHLLGASSQDRTCLFFNLFPIFGLVPEETHGGVSNLEVGSKVLDGLKAIIVIIEL